MKKWMAILVFAASASAVANVNFTATGDVMGRLQIAYTTTNGDLPRAVALRVQCGNGGTVDMTSAVVVDPAFNAFIDWAFSNPLNFEIGNGHPLANANQAGALSANASEFSICMGVLDQLGTQRAGPASSNLIVVQLRVLGDGGSATISEDTFRGGVVGDIGGIVGENGQKLTTNLPITVSFPCFCCQSVKSSAPIYNDWVAFGMPRCWAYARNCKGDADGLKQGSPITGYWWVGTNDLNILIKGWQVKEKPKGPGIMTVPSGICADFARDKQGSAITGYWRVGTSDLNILIANWQIIEPPKGRIGMGDCMATGHYNYFAIP
jgi:hypothetical protein